MHEVTVTYKVFSVKELSEKARGKAFDKWYNDQDYPSARDNENTLDKFQSIFPVHVTDFDYGYKNYIRFGLTCDSEVAHLRGVRLMKYIYNNYFNYIFTGKYYYTRGYYDEQGKYHYKCRQSKIMLVSDCPLTGYYLDIDILEPILDFLKNPEDISMYGLMKKCLDNWVNACNNDYENYFSMDSFIEESESFGCEYLENGELWRG